MKGVLRLCRWQEYVTYKGGLGGGGGVEGGLYLCIDTVQSKFHNLISSNRVITLT